MDNENYISPNKITKQYDITSGTLRRWAEAGKIRCLRPNGGKRIYNIEDIKNMSIIVPKPSIMNKYKLEELFNEVDNLKEALENNKKEYQKQLDKLFESFQQNTN